MELIYENQATLHKYILHPT